MKIGATSWRGHRYIQARRVPWFSRLQPDPTPKREEFFGPLGATEIKTYVDPAGSNRVGVTMNIADMDAVMAAMETPEAADVMEHDGVIPRPW